VIIQKRVKIWGKCEEIYDKMEFLREIYDQQIGNWKTYMEKHLNKEKYG